MLTIGIMTYFRKLNSTKTGNGMHCTSQKCSRYLGKQHSFADTSTYQLYILPYMLSNNISIVADFLSDQQTFNRFYNKLTDIVFQRHC